MTASGYSVRPPEASNDLPVPRGFAWFGPVAEKTPSLQALILSQSRPHLCNYLI